MYTLYIATHLLTNQKAGFDVLQCMGNMYEHTTRLDSTCHCAIELTGNAVRDI